MRHLIYMGIGAVAGYYAGSYFGQSSSNTTTYQWGGAALGAVAGWYVAKMI